MSPEDRFRRFIRDCADQQNLSGVRKRGCFVERALADHCLSVDSFEDGVCLHAWDDRNMAFNVIGVVAEVVAAKHFRVKGFPFFLFLGASVSSIPGVA